MSESQQVFRNTAVLTVSRVVERASSIFLILVVSRILHAVGVGVYATAIAYFGLISLAARMGVANFLVREVAKDQSKTNCYVVHLSMISMVAGAVVMVLSIAILPHLGYSPELTRSVYLVILAIIPESLNGILEAVFVARQRVELQTYTTCIAAIVNISVSLYLLTHGYGVVSLVVAFVVMKYLILGCYFFFYYYYIAALQWEFRLSVVRALFPEIKNFAASSLLGGLFARPEIVLLSFVKGEEQTGFYSAALKLVDIWYLLPDTYMTNVFPVLSRSYHLADHKSQLIADRSFKYLLAMSLPLAVGLTVAAEPIVALLYGPGFEPSVHALQILAWNLPLYCLNDVFWRVLVARGEQSLNVRIQMISTCVRLTGGYALISVLGPLGAAMVTVTSLLLHNRLLSLAVKHDGTRMSPWRVSWRFVAVALIMGAIIAPLCQQLQLWALISLAATLYIVLVFVFKAFSPEDFALFRHLYLPDSTQRKL